MFCFTVWVAVCGSSVYNQAQDWNYYWWTLTVHTGPVPVCAGSVPCVPRGPCQTDGAGYKGEGKL